jgi:hypothetical protein
MLRRRTIERVVGLDLTSGPTDFVTARLPQFILPIGITFAAPALPQVAQHSSLLTLKGSNQWRIRLPALGK